MRRSSSPPVRWIAPDALTLHPLGGEQLDGRDSTRGEVEVACHADYQKPRRVDT